MTFAFNALVCICLLSLFATLVKSQELPLHYVEKWAEGFNYRTNFCPIHEAVERGEIQRRDALRGMNFTVGFMTYQLSAETGGIDAENPDIAMEMLDHLASMAGFAYRNTYAVIDPPVGNETWSQLLFWSVDVYDLMGEWFIESVERLTQGNVLYPEGWYDGNFILVQRYVTEDSGGYDLFAWTEPFTPALWGLIAATTVVSGFVYYILDYFDSRVSGRKMDVSLGESLFYTAFSFNGHYTQQPKFPGTRILVFSMAFFFLIIVAAYTANLASFLVLRNQPQVVINSIQDAIRHDLRICVQRGAATHDHLNTYRIPRSRVIAGDNPNGWWIDLLAGECDVLLTTVGEYEIARRNTDLNPYCDLSHIGRIVKYESAGFVAGDSEFYCTSLLRDVLHMYILEMKDSPIFDTIWNEYREKAATSSCELDTGGVDNEEEHFGSMGVENFSGMFVLHLIALGVALLSTLYTVFRQPKERRKKMKSDMRKFLRGSRLLEEGNFSESELFRNGKVKHLIGSGGKNSSQDEKFEVDGDFASSDNFGGGNEWMEPENFMKILQAGEEKSRAVMEENNKRHREEMDQNNRRHQLEMEENNRKHREEMEEFHRRHQEEMEAKNQQHQEDREERNRKQKEDYQRYQEELDKTHERHREEMEVCHKRHRQQMEEFFKISKEEKMEEERQQQLLQKIILDKLEAMEGTRSNQNATESES